jgi:hypothetical protein
MLSGALCTTSRWCMHARSEKKAALQVEFLAGTARCLFYMLGASLFCSTVCRILEPRACGVTCSLRREEDISKLTSWELVHLWDYAT